MGKRDVIDRELKRRRETLENLSHGDVIRYPGNVYWDERSDTYLVVDRVEDGKIYGYETKPHSVDSISIDDLVRGDIEVLRADWKEI